MTDGSEQSLLMVSNPIGLSTHDQTGISVDTDTSLIVGGNDTGLTSLETSNQGGTSLIKEFQLLPANNGVVQIVGRFISLSTNSDLALSRSASITVLLESRQLSWVPVSTGINHVCEETLSLR